MSSRPGLGPEKHHGVSVAEADARYQRERLALYRARVHSGKATSLERLHELERNSARADAWARRVREQ